MVKPKKPRLYKVNKKMIEGSCLCGGVKFQIEGEVTPIQKCHATRCRKATGGAYAPELLTSIEGFTWLKGKELITVYAAPLINAPPLYKRAFCKKCGSPLPVEIEGTSFMLLLAGTLDSNPGVSEFRHAFTGQKACWHEITDNLPSYEEEPPVPEEYKQ